MDENGAQLSFRAVHGEESGLEDQGQILRRVHLRMTVAPRHFQSSIKLNLKQRSNPGAGRCLGFLLRAHEHHDKPSSSKAASLMRSFVHGGSQTSSTTA